MLSSVYKKGTYLVKVWYLLFGLQILLFACACLYKVTSSGWWILDFLTLVKGEKIAWWGLIINGAIVSFDIYTCNQMNKEVMWGMSKPNSYKEEKCLDAIKKYLRTIIVLLLMYLFLQVMYGVLWWIVGVGILAWKYLVKTELENLKKYNK